MRLYAVCAAAVAVLAAATLSAEPSSSEMKCPPDTPIQFPDAPEPAYVLDAKAVDESALRRLDHDSIASLHIVCAVDLHRVFGVEAQRSGVVVFTKPGPHAELKSSLETIRTRQAAYYAERGEFATDPAQLEWSDESGLMTMTLKVSESGRSWAATGTHLYMINESSLSVTGEAPGSGGGDGR
jgi:hypothetical protein